MKKSTLLYAIMAAILVVAAVAYIATASPSGKLDQYIGVQVNQSYMAQLQSIANNQALANKVGIGVVSGPPTKVSANTLMLNGKPEILYVGADYCPYCAAARWSLVLALMRFGTVSNLAYMTSNGSDIYPNTPTFTFANITYTSSAISLVAKETETRAYQPFQSLTSSENHILLKFDSTESVPFIDFANYSIQLGAPIDPAMMDGHTWNQIASDISNPSTKLSQGVIGAANIYTAYICEVSNNTPSVCSQTYVKALEKIYGG